MNEEICAAIRKAADDDPFLTAFGLRIPHGRKRWRPGMRVPASYRWEDGRRTRRRLPGTSSIGIDARWDVDPGLEDRVSTMLDRIANYLSLGDSGQLLLIAGEYNGPGQDPGEIFVIDAEVVAVWTYTT